MSRYAFIQSQNCISGRIFLTGLFNVTFVNERGEGGSAMWLTGNLFHSVITHSLKKIKYVYDNTVNPKPHWVSAELVYEQNVTSLSQRME